MRSLLLVPLAALALAVEGALLAVFHVEIVRPDPVLVMVVLLAFSPDPATLWSLAALGFLADSMAGAPAGLSVCIYLSVFGMARVVLRMLVPERRMVQLGMIFAASLAAAALLGLLVRLGPSGPELGARLWLWSLPLALVNCLLGLLLWSPLRWVLSRQARPGRLGAA